MIRKEMSQVLHDTEKSSTRKPYSQIMGESYTSLQQKGPVLVGFLDACIPKNSSKRESTIMTCIGILVKSHNRNTLLHLFTSLVLSAGHAGKQVSVCIYIQCLLTHAAFHKCL